MLRGAQDPPIGCQGHSPFPKAHPCGAKAGLTSSSYLKRGIRRDSDTVIALRVGSKGSGVGPLRRVSPDLF